MKNIKKFVSPLIILLVVLVIVITPIVSFAQATVPKPVDSGGTVPAPATSTTKIINPLGTDSPDITAFIKHVLIGALKIAIPVVALAIIYSGFLFVFAMGNSEKITKARNALLYSLIGAAILLGSWAIANLIVSTIGAL